jgi:transposase-like protein
MHYNEEKQELILREQAASGLSMPEFSQRTGIEAKKLYGWRRKFRERAAGKQPGTAEFARVQSGHSVEITTGSGLKIKVPLESLRAVLKELEG